jgi:hypothetical protein
MFCLHSHTFLELYGMPHIKRVFQPNHALKFSWYVLQKKKIHLIDISNANKFFQAFLRSCMQSHTCIALKSLSYQCGLGLFMCLVFDRKLFRTARCLYMPCVPTINPHPHESHSEWSDNEVGVSFSPSTKINNTNYWLFKNNMNYFFD